MSETTLLQFGEPDASSPIFLRSLGVNNTYWEAAVPLGTLICPMHSECVIRKDGHSITVSRRTENIKTTRSVQSVIQYDHLSMLYSGVEKYLNSIKAQMASEIGRKLYEDGIVRVTEKATDQGLIVRLELELGK